MNWRLNYIPWSILAVSIFVSFLPLFCVTIFHLLRTYWHSNRFGDEKKKKEIGDRVMGDFLSTHGTFFLCYVQSSSVLYISWVVKWKCNCFFVRVTWKITFYKKHHRISHKGVDLHFTYIKYLVVWGDEKKKRKKGTGEKKWKCEKNMKWWALNGFTFRHNRYFGQTKDWFQVEFLGESFEIVVACANAINLFYASSNMIIFFYHIIDLFTETFLS